MTTHKVLYSDKYYDDKYEYRHIQITPEIAKLVPQNRLMTEDEWRAIGIRQSPGWIHYMVHEPEPHILLFRRPVDGPPPSQEQQFEMEMKSRDE